MSLSNWTSKHFLLAALAAALAVAPPLGLANARAAEPDELIKDLAQDEAIAEADTLLLTVPNQLGVAYNAHVIEAILTHVAPALGWR